LAGWRMAASVVSCMLRRLVELFVLRRDSDDGKAVESRGRVTN
jgi:hypothetical protein